MATRRRRLDAELVRRGLTAGPQQARQVIEAGRITVDGAPAANPGRLVGHSEVIRLAPPEHRFVSRGGDKLDHGLEAFAVEVAGRHALDAGAATGGFTDCLLQRGAARVVAVDVGYGELADALRRDSRVHLLERTNIRDLEPGDIPPPTITLAVADLSFIGLDLVLPVLRTLTDDLAEAVVLVKPQFEAERDQVGPGGVVRDPATWRAALESVVQVAAALRWGPVDAAASPLLGPAGNVEFLLHLAPGPPPRDLPARLHRAIEAGVGLQTASDG